MPVWKLIVLAGFVALFSGPAMAQEATQEAAATPTFDPLAPVASDAPYKPAADPAIAERWETARATLAAKDYATAIPLLEPLCLEGFYNSCSTVARAFAGGQGVEKDPAKAMSLFELGCRSRFASNCVFLAQIYDTGTFGTKDDAKAHAYMLAACRVSDFEACWAAGEQFENGKGTPVNRDDALKAYTFACDNGVAGACTDIGDLYSPFPINPETEPNRDYVKAAEFYRKGCEGGDGEGCGLLADQHETGLGVEKNLDTALELYRKAAAMDIEQWVRTSVEGRIKALEAQKAKAGQ